MTHPKTIVFLGERGAFDIHAAPGSMLHTDVFSLGPGEQASFNNGRFRLMLGPLRRDLTEGDVIEVTFAFDQGSTVVPVHVHAAKVEQCDLQRRS